MSLEKLRWAFAQRQAKGGAKLVLLALANECRNGSDTCWPSQKLLRDLTGFPQRTLIRHLHDLLSLHPPIVEVEHRGSDSGGRASNIYTLLSANMAHNPAQNTGDIDPELSANMAFNGGLSANMALGLSAKSAGLSAISAGLSANMAPEPGKEPGKNQEKKGSANAPTDAELDSVPPPKPTRPRRRSTKPKPPSVDLDAYVTPDWLDRDLWLAWNREVREVKAATQSTLALDRVIAQLDQLRNRYDPNRLLGFAYENGWKGIYERPDALWPAQNGTNGAPHPNTGATDEKPNSDGPGRRESFVERRRAAARSDRETLERIKRGQPLT